MHTCPFCGEECDCDMDDCGGLPVPDDCPHLCDELDERTEGDEDLMDRDEAAEEAELEYQGRMMGKSPVDEVKDTLTRMVLAQGYMAAKKYPVCQVHGMDMVRIVIDGDPDSGRWMCPDCKEEEEILHGTGEGRPLGVIEYSPEEEAAAQVISERLREMYNLGAVRGDRKVVKAEYRSPTKKVKEESKKRRQMAKASRKKNRR